MRVLHDWSFAFYVYVIYRVVLLQAGPGWSGRVFDAWLIDADRWMLGVAPTVWLMRRAHPIVTEVLQVAYSMFYLLPLAVALENYSSGLEWRFRHRGFVLSCGICAAVAAVWASALATSKPLTKPPSKRWRVRRALCCWMARFRRAISARCWKARSSM